MQKKNLKILSYALLAVAFLCQCGSDFLEQEEMKAELKEELLLELTGGTNEPEA